MGSGQHGQAKLIRLAAPRSTRLFLRNCDCPHHRKLGSGTSLPLHHGSRILRLDSFLGCIACRPREFSLASHSGGNLRSSDALSSRPVGFCIRLCPGLRRGSPHAFRLASQRDRRSHVPRHANPRILSLETSSSGVVQLKVCSRAPIISLLNLFPRAAIPIGRIFGKLRLAR